MGVDYYAYAFIGQKINKQKMNKDVLTAGCNHQNPGTANFCSVCGKRAFTVTQQPVIDFESLKGISAIESTDNEEIFLALNHHQVKSGTSRGGENLAFRILDSKAVEEAKTVLKELLEPYGLWDEKQFGLWTVLYCSY